MLELIFANIFSGGATGIIGVIAQRFADYKNKQLDIALEKQRGELELQKRQVDLQITQSEYEGKLKVASEEGATAKDVADTQAFSQTLWKEPERYSQADRLTPAQMWVMVVLDALRGCVRPLLTIYLCALTTYVWVQVRGVLSAEELDSAAALEVWRLVVGQILYLTTTVTLWWFGTRNKSVPPHVK